MNIRLTLGGAAPSVSKRVSDSRLKHLIRHRAQMYLDGDYMLMALRELQARRKIERKALGNCERCGENHYDMSRPRVPTCPFTPPRTGGADLI